MLDSRRGALLAPCVLLVLASCGGGSSPSAPTPQTPAPPAIVSLTGSVSTNLNESVIGADVRILDGPNAGRTTTTNSAGRYRFDNLTRGNANVEAAFPDYQSARAGVFIDGVNSLDFVLQPVPRALFQRSGRGNTVFDMPRTVRRVRIVGRYSESSQNFIVWINDDLVVNELLGTFWGQTRYDGTHATTGGEVRIENSSGVQWSFTEVR